MKLTIKLTPPYKKKDSPAEFEVELNSEKTSVHDLVQYLAREHHDRFDFPLIDKKGIITAEFMVNSKHEPLRFKVSDGDHITVIPYIGGG